MANQKIPKYTLLYNGSSKIKTFNLSLAKILSITLLVLMVISTAIYLSSSWLAAYKTRLSMAEVMTENRNLRRQLQHTDKRIEELAAQVAELARGDDTLRLLAGLDRIDKDTRQMGIGGALLPELDGYLNGDSLTNRLDNILDQIEREARLQSSSYREIWRQLNSNKLLEDHLPSIRPVQTGYISSKFGKRTDPFTKRPAHHNGVDISTERGTPVYATAKGKVIFAKRTPGLGNLVIVDHGLGYRTIYGHLDRIIAVKGQTVERWQEIGKVGNTGRSTAPHLHYEVHKNEIAVDPFDYFITDVPIVGR